MKKLYFYYFLINFFINILTLQPDFFQLGIPLINHYGPPYLLPTLFSYQQKAENITNAPLELQRALLKKLGVKYKNESEVTAQLKDIIKNKLLDLNFYSIIWQSDQTQSWPKDRIYNCIYHQIAQKWLEQNASAGFNPENFSTNICMGIFSPDGLEELNQPGSCMPFERLEERNVHLHEQAYSPNNANFKMVDDRSVAHFWSIAISSDENHAVLINNIIINNTDLEKLLLVKINPDLNKTIKGLNETITIMNSDGKYNDARALSNFTSTLQKTGSLEAQLE